MESDAMQNLLLQATAVRPSLRQLAWQETEFYAFIHFGVNTFTGREWGTGTEDPAIFNPSAFDARQWVQVIKAGGMRGLILTAKHHDGFCLWPSKYTEHSVKYSPWRDGQGDMVAEVAEACRNEGIKFGIYLSPWDRHELTYGDSPRYNIYFKNQLRELLTHYGDLFCVWLDGACGEGPNGQRQQYDWDGIYTIVRELQPNAVISVCGPDVRWCGNEAGHCRPSEWSVVPALLQDAEKIAEKSQQEDSREFARQVRSDEDDLGSREKIRSVGQLVWYPAEVNTSIRPGWFYHPEEDHQVKSLSQLLDIYFDSVGGNATFLLNFPPDRRGLIHENDAQCAVELGVVLRETFAHNLAHDAHVTASHVRANHHGYDPTYILDEDNHTCWAADDWQEQATLTFCLPEPRTFNVALLQEQIIVGQRVERFRLSAMIDGTWEMVAESTTIGYRRLLRFPCVTTHQIRLDVLESRIYPTLSRFGLYHLPRSKILSKGVFSVRRPIDSRDEDL